MSRLYDALQNAHVDSRSGAVRAAVPAAAASPRLAPAAADGDILRLYQAIEAVLAHRARKVVAVVACARGEGASTVAARLARLAAGPMCHSTLLLHGTSQPVPLKSAQPGAEALPEAANLADVVAADGPLLNARTLRAVWDRLRADHELVVVDLPPIRLAPLALAVTPTVDGVVLVVEAERTRAAVAREAADALQAAGGNLLGVVLNKVRR